MKYWRVLVVLSLPVQILIVQLISLAPAWVERFYTGGFFKYLSGFLRALLGNIPVPVGQLLFYSWVSALLAALLRQGYILWKKRQTFKAFMGRVLFGIVAFLSGFYFLFTVMWGLNYHRRPIEDTIQLQTRPVTTAELKTLCQKLIQLTNASRNHLTVLPPTQPLRPGQMITRATAGFVRAARIYPQLKYTRLSVKPVYVPQLMSYFGVGGIYFPFTGEANVNMHPPAFLLPATICHEMAHQIGFASEDEANYVAYLVCRLNPDPQFRYSGNYMAMKYALNRLKRINQTAYTKLLKTVNAGVARDLAENRRYWEKYQNPLETFSDWFYDLFLKANDQTEGIESYTRVVELLMAEYRKNQLTYPE